MKLRLLPIVVFAGSSLLVLKLLGFFLGDTYPIGAVRVADAQQSAPAVAETEAVPDPSVLPNPSGARKIQVAQNAEGVKNSGVPTNSVSELAVLNSLGNRRDALNQREKDLELRAQVLAAAEARLNKRFQELKALEAKIDSEVERKEKQAAEEIMDLVKIYESMKAKNAARIFNRLDLDIMLKVVKQMQPRKMADVLSEMDPEMAEQLTIALAAGESRNVKTTSTILPKIQGN
ncbi:MgtE intracellular N domain-containing protein [Pseudovibrio denitrificans]|uniref:MgtE intracellular N domain-containing protein n=1 Tax=Pseudovibrio denitrificans TaxID=258256 RepID=A0A1I6ZMX7_9HYPH|nr:FlaA [Pseudovibrio denitrificans]SFT64089.1 MgtE intracellular N domain-containing protein [Pseudovibrio denitrificans]